MESQPQNPEFRNNPENFHPCIRLEMCLAVSYDAHVLLPAFHALKAWRLAVMASHFLIPPPSSQSPWVGLCCATYILSCLQQTCLQFRPDFSTKTYDDPKHMLKLMG